MCFGGGKTPEVAAAPAAQPLPPPTPSPSPAQSPAEQQQTAQQKRNKVDALRYGSMNTIRNTGGAQGLSGTGPDLSAPQAQGGQKKNLGA